MKATFTYCIVLGLSIGMLPFWNYAAAEGDKRIHGLFYVNADGTGLRPQISDPVQLSFQTPECSPDGRSIVYSASGSGGRQIWIAELDGRSARMLAPANAADSYEPKWSPDGKSIAFTSNRTGDTEVFVVGIDGTNLRNVTNSSGADYSPNWYPGGTRLIFVTQRTGDVYLHSINADGSEAERIAPTPEGANIVGKPAVSPDGSRIAYLGRGVEDRPDVFMMDRDGTNSRNITRSPQSEDSPSWSPSGNMVAFARYGQVLDIIICAPHGGNQLNLTNGHGVNSEPSWTPGGRGIIFLTRRDAQEMKEFGLGPFESIVLLRDGGLRLQRRVGNAPPVSVEFVDNHGMVTLRALSESEAEVEFRRRGLPPESLRELYR